MLKILNLQRIYVRVTYISAIYYFLLMKMVVVLLLSRQVNKIFVNIIKDVIRKFISKQRIFLYNNGDKIDCIKLCARH